MTRPGLNLRYSDKQTLEKFAVTFQAIFHNMSSQKVKLQINVPDCEGNYLAEFAEHSNPKVFTEMF